MFIAIGSKLMECAYLRIVAYAVIVVYNNEVTNLLFMS